MKDKRKDDDSDSERKKRKKDKSRKKGRERQERKSKRHKKSSSRKKIADAELAHSLASSLLRQFSSVEQDFILLLKRLDGGDAVDIGGVTDPALVKLLTGIFNALGLKRDGTLFDPEDDGASKGRFLKFMLPVLSGDGRKQAKKLIKAGKKERKERAKEPERGKDSSKGGDGIKRDRDDVSSSSDSRGSSEPDGPPEGPDASPSDESSSSDEEGPQSPPSADKRGAAGGHPPTPPSSDGAAVDGNQPSTAPAPARPRIGPCMPTAEDLAALASAPTAPPPWPPPGITRDGRGDVDGEDEDEDNELLIGPPPPFFLDEDARASGDQREAEVARILSLKSRDAYDILGVEPNAAPGVVKKRFWKLSLLVHPDKCSHPKAGDAFGIVDKAAKELMDAGKRAALDGRREDEKLRQQFEAELVEKKEAAIWRRARGEATAEDEELLKAPEAPLKRDEWLTSLPVARKPPNPMSMKNREFSRRDPVDPGDTSVWTDTPQMRAERAKQQYLEDYQGVEARKGRAAEVQAQAAAKKATETAALVDSYNQQTRHLSLWEKKLEAEREEKKRKKAEKAARAAAKGGQVLKPEAEAKEDWEGLHPWKPWNRETDLEVGGKAKPLTSKALADHKDSINARFGAPSGQRHFL
eukprot:jgi/Mesvir1/6093/Mv00810-RA.1